MPLAASLLLIPLWGLALAAPGSNASPSWGLSCAHKSAPAQVSLSALYEAAEEAVVLSAAGCTNVTLIIS